MPKTIMSDAEIMDYFDAAIDKDRAIDALAVKLRTSRAEAKAALKEGYDG